MPYPARRIASHLSQASPTAQRIRYQLSSSRLSEEDPSLGRPAPPSFRSNTSHAVLSYECIGIPELVENVVSEIKAEQLTVEIEPGLGLLELDATRIRILLRNLLGNALSHGDNPKRHPVLQVGYNTGMLSFIVTDFGPGISDKHIGRVTEPFYRADPSRTRNTGGSGLGLHLASLIASAHGGSLKIETGGSHDGVHPDADENDKFGTRVIATVSAPVC